MSKKNDDSSPNLKTSEGLNDFFSDLSDDDEIDGDYDEIDQLIDEVMALLENYGNFSGGLITLKTIIGYLKQRNFSEHPQADYLEMIRRLRQNEVILDEISFNDVPNRYIYVFKELTINPMGKELMKISLNTPKMTLSEIKAQITSNDAKIEEELHLYINQKIMKQEAEKFSFLGII